MASKSVTASSSGPGRRNNTACNRPISEETPQSPQVVAMSSVIAERRGDHSSPPYAAERIDVLTNETPVAASVGGRYGGLVPERSGQSFRPDGNAENAASRQVTTDRKSV